MMALEETGTPIARWHLSVRALGWTPCTRGTVESWRGKGVTMTEAAEATVLVTGATDGLGRSVAQELAAKGATVLLHGRNMERLRAALDRVREETGNEKLLYYLADLSPLEAARDLSERILSEHDRLDGLVINAGIIVQERKESEDGYEIGRAHV